MTKKSEANKRWRDSHPLEYCFQNLRNNARRRLISFELTLEQFREFCYLTKYIKRKGVWRHCYTIDRIRNNEGYHIGNIAIMRKDKNCSKGAKIVEFVWQGKTPFTVKKYTYAAV